MMRASRAAGLAAAACIAAAVAAGLAITHRPAPAGQAAGSRPASGAAGPAVRLSRPGSGLAGARQPRRGPVAVRGGRHGLAPGGLRTSRVPGPGAGPPAAGGAGAGPGPAAPGPPAPGSAVIRVAPGTPLGSLRPVAGSTYLFTRGATYTGTLRVSADNVVIDSRGPGSYPVFTRSAEGADVTLAGTGDYLSHIRLTGRGYRQVPGCGPAATAGYEIGVDIAGVGDTVDSVRADGNLYAGVYIGPAGSYATIRHSVFDHVDSLNPSDFGAGAFGILIWGDHNTVDADTFANQSTCSPVYGRDGSGVEIYHGSYNLIEHSTGRSDTDFTELGGRGATSNTYVGNRFAGPGEFLVTRGSRDTADGPVHDTRLIGNVAHGAVVSYGWQPGSGTLLIMKDNHVSSLSQDGGFIDLGGTVTGF